MAPLIDKYCKHSLAYPDACQQDMNKQLAWIELILTVSKEDWVIVAGNHPVYVKKRI